MKVEDVLKMMDPESVIGIMEPGLHKVKYTGWVLGAAGRRDLTARDVSKIGQEIIEGMKCICIYI